MRKKVYLVELIDAERQALSALIHAGTTRARMADRAPILLHADEGKPDKEIAAALHTSASTVGGEAEGVSARAETEFLPLLRAQSGFIRHVAFRLAEDRTMTFAAFASREQLEATEEATTAWREAVAPLTTATRRHAGEVVWSIRKD